VCLLLATPIVMQQVPAVHGDAPQVENSGIKIRRHALHQEVVPRDNKEHIE